MSVLSSLERKITTTMKASQLVVRLHGLLLIFKVLHMFIKCNICAHKYSHIWAFFPMHVVNKNSLK